VIVDNIFLESIYSKRFYVIYLGSRQLPINSYVIDYRLLLTSHISVKKLFPILQTIRIETQYYSAVVIHTHTNKTSKNVWKKIWKQRDTKVPLIANYLILHLSLQRIRIFRKINYKKKTREKCKFSRVVHCQKYFSRNLYKHDRSRTLIKLKNYLFNNWITCFVFKSLMKLNFTKEIKDYCYRRDIIKGSYYRSEVFVTTKWI